ncbi:hypothetical protein EDD85DRAFT_979306 [Armillaria nabsnona]|nr:hypothetical protein EDD85DRAFT_979306 [Armillaria nabsnona]
MLRENVKKLPARDSLVDASTESKARRIEKAQNFSILQEISQTSRTDGGGAVAKTSLVPDPDGKRHPEKQRENSQVEALRIMASMTVTITDVSKDKGPKNAAGFSSVAKYVDQSNERKGRPSRQVGSQDKVRVDAYARRLEFEVKTVQYELGLQTYIATEIALGSRLGQTKLYTTGGLRLQQVPDTDATHAFLMEEKCKEI